ncbi:MAG: glutamyl-tRNA reductase [Anaerolineae bacterium]|jgi:glutamyl-tRNA reductase|nr:glutamyl-tRNA reductase [Anaerolineae bacterium]
MPHLLLIGLSHRTAPVALRERVHRSGAALTDALRAWVSLLGVSEAAMVSTCNRVEVLLAVSEVEAARRAVLERWAADSDLSADDLATNTYTYADAEAVAHVMEVAAGLDSLVLGETQILGQLADALRAAQAAQTAGTLTQRLMMTALHTGKRTRTETHITHGARSVASAAAHAALHAVHGLNCPLIVILGAGEMGQGAARALKGRGGVRIVLVNRTDERAERAAALIGVESHPWARLHDALAAADAVIAATGAQTAVLTADDMADLMARRPGRPLTVVDIAVPRAVEPVELPGLTLQDIDGLRAALDHADTVRQTEAVRAAELCAAAADDFMRWLGQREAVPAIIALRQYAHRLAESAVEAALGQHISDEHRQRAHRAARRTVNQLLHAPTLTLKSSSAARFDPEQAASWAQALHSALGQP